jgi:ParB-like chromosome segregation protein Spo0J
MDTATRNGQHTPLAIPCSPPTTHPVLEHAHPHATFSYDPPPSLARPDPDQRDRSDPKYIESRDTVLRPDIRRRGIQVPLLAFLRADGRKQVFDGGTRLECALLDGIELVPVLTYPAKPSASELRIATFLANENRLDWSPAERGRFYFETMRKEGWTQAEMCRHIPGLKPARVCKTLKWLENLPPEFHDKVAEGDGLIPERGAYTICDFPLEERKDLCEKFIAGRMTVELLDTLRQKRKGTTPKAKPLKLRLDGVQMVASNATLEGLQAFGERLVAAVKRLVKDGDTIEYLPSRLKAP